MLYFSALARPQQAMTLVLRGAGARVPAAAVRRAVASADPTLPPPTVSDLDELVGDALATPRFAAILFGIFAGVALVLATVGVYGVMSYLVRQRTHEFGVRSALGTAPGVLVRSVVTGALRLTLAGVAVGLVAARLLTHFLGSRGGLTATASACP